LRAGGIKRARIKGGGWEGGGGGRVDALEEAWVEVERGGVREEGVGGEKRRVGEGRGECGGWKGGCEWDGRQGEKGTDLGRGGGGGWKGGGGRGWEGGRQGVGEVGGKGEERVGYYL